MSKYLMMVDLPDDSRCRGCPLFNEEQSTCPEMEELIDMNVWENPLNWNRNKNNDCPLIPVDEMLDAIKSHKVLAPGGSHDDGVATAIWAMKAALGVTE